MKKQASFLCVLFLLSGFCLKENTLFAQSAPRLLSPDEAVELAIKNNLSLESARLDASGKKRTADSRLNVFIPTVSVGGSLSRSNTVETASGFVPVDITSGLGFTPPPSIYGVVPYSMELPQWSLVGSLQVSLGLSAASFEGMKKARLDYEAGLISLERARLQLERDVRKLYYQILLVKESVELLRESAANLERRVNMAQANYMAGLIPEVSLLQARVALENLKPTINNTESQYKLAMAQFAMNLGLPYDSQFELIEAPENVAYIPLDTAELISRAAVEKPEIQELKQQILSVKSQRQSLFYQLYTPSLQLSWTLTPAFTDDPMKASWFSGNKWNTDRGAFTISLGFSLNGLIPFTKENNALKDLDDGISKMHIGLAQAVQGTEVEIYNTVLGLEQTRTTAEAQALAVQLAERTLRLSEQAYRSGLKEFLDVQNDELALRQARFNMLQQNYSYLTGLLDLEYAIGVPFGSLGERN
jgi:outer membrane protein TolC